MKYRSEKVEQGEKTIETSRIYEISHEMTLPIPWLLNIKNIEIDTRNPIPIWTEKRLMFGEARNKNKKIKNKDKNNGKTQLAVSNRERKS